MNPAPQPTGIERAIEAVGGQAALALALDVTQQTISEWKSRGYPPKGRVKEIARLTGVPAIDLIDPEIAELIDPSKAFDVVEEIDDADDLA